MNKQTRELVITGIFAALCIVLPILFHTVGLGPVFLPLLFPIALGAFFLRPGLAMALGLLGPFLSALLTSMPPFAPPIAQIIMMEGVVLGGTISILNMRFQWGILLPLITGLVLSRVVLLVFMWLLAPILGLPPKIYSLASVVSGLPGIALQLIFVPLVVNRIKQQKII